MKLLFIENRYATEIWEAVAKGLAAHGHEIYWLIQNPVFTPKFGTTHFIKFPTRNQLKPNASLEWLRDLDRGVRWFGGDGTHWDHYNQQIAAVIQKIKPDVIFGEPTEFHELLALENARSLGIPFLHPTSTRYPVGRLNFFSYDSMTAVGGEANGLSVEELENMLDGIVHRKIKPSYMTSAAQPAWKKKLRGVANKARIMSGWLRGERYITPSPLKKWVLEKEHAKNFARWESFSEKSFPSELLNKPTVLFPLQMQPEANIELWGRPWSDQLAIAKRAAKALEPMACQHSSLHPKMHQ